MKQFQYCKKCMEKFGIRKQIYRCPKCGSTNISKDYVKNMKSEIQKRNKLGI